MGTERLVQFIPYNIAVSSTVLGAGGGGTIMAYTEPEAFFRLQVHEREGIFIVEVNYERDQNEISHRCILWM